MHLQVYRVPQSRDCNTLLARRIAQAGVREPEAQVLQCGLTTWRKTQVGSAGGRDTFLNRRCRSQLPGGFHEVLVDWAFIHPEGLTGICETSGHRALTLGKQVLGAHRSVSTRPSNTCRRPCLDALGDNTWDPRG